MKITEADIMDRAAFEAYPEGDELPSMRFEVTTEPDKNTPLAVETYERCRTMYGTYQWEFIRFTPLNNTREAAKFINEQNGIADVIPADPTKPRNLL